MRRSSRHCISLLVLVSTVTAQDLLDLAWQRHADGTLWVQVPPGPNDPRQPPPEVWEPMFPVALSAKTTPTDDVYGLLRGGPIMLLPLLLTGDGGAACNADAELCRRKLGVRVHLFGGPVVPNPDPLVDLLRVQYLASLDLLAASSQLGYYTKPAHDVFVRGAAAAALRGRELGPTPDQLAAAAPVRDAAAALRHGLASLPARFDLLLGVTCARMPTPGPLLRGMRQMGLRLGSQVALQAGGSVSPYQVLGMQLMIDAPGQLPYELATRFGNWRVDYALLALQRAAANRWWFHLDGAFQPQRIANGLAQAGFLVHADGKDGITADVLGWKLTANPTALECWQDGCDLSDAGSRAAEFTPRGEPSAPPVWLHLPADSAVPASLGLSIRGFDLALFVQPAGFSATADCAEVQAAVQLQQSFANWRKQHTLDPAAPIEPGDTQLWQDLDAQPHGCMESPRARLALSRRLQQVRCEILGSKVKWSFDAATLDMFELVQLYRAFAWLLNGR